MKLEFEIVEEVGEGNFGDLLHFANSQAQLFSIQNGEIFGKPSKRIENGVWDIVEFSKESNVSPDTNITNFQVDKLQNFGAIGCYLTEDTHKLIIYEFAYEMDRFLNSGSIKHSLDNPISSFSLSLENPINENPEHGGNVAVAENSSLLSPGAKVSFMFSMGDSEEYELGSFYVDRSNLTLLEEIANVNGRNLIGKILKDQTLDEGHVTGYDYVSTILESLLQHAGLDRNQYAIENSSTRNWFIFSPVTKVLESIEEILKAMIDWKIEEKVDGTVVIGSPTYSVFQNRSIYSFYRNKDIFSRTITRDDAESYKRVCVHDAKWNIKVYKDVLNYEGWNLQSSKTLYVEVAEGTREIEALLYVAELARRLENVGKLEAFSGPFRPYILCGDEAIIIGDDGTESLGIITEVTHNFGKKGYTTSFTVDSGGRLGKGNLSKFVSQINKVKPKGIIGYVEI